MSTRPSISRRSFLKLSATTGAGLIIGFHLPGSVLASLPPGIEPNFLLQESLAPNAYLKIDPNGMVTIYIPRSELGQGVNTSLAMILADELEVDFATVHVEQAGADPSRYGDQLTGGSTSIQSSYSAMRIAGAAGRTVLIAAAAKVWGVDKTECYAQLGRIIHRPSDQSLSYGELVATAAQMPPLGYADLANVVLKDKKDFRIIGTPRGQIDNPQFVAGTALYASDISLPGMLYAVVARCPTFGGKVASFDDSKAKAVPGVVKIIQIRNGVAVVAESTWAALQGRQMLEVTWDNGPNAELTSDSLAKLRADAVKELAAKDTSTADNIDRTIEALYESPYLAHAPMEPMICVADVRADSCEVWAPTQDRQQALNMAQATARVATQLHVPLVGGAFGRRLNVDYVPEAVEISKAMGKPVKVFWSRQDDLQHDFYRPASHHLLRAGLDKSGMPVLWQHYIASQSIGGGSYEIAQGASDLPYQIKKSVQASAMPPGIPVGYWRSVYNPPNAFANESFMDEIAAASGRDPYELRLQLLRDNSRLKPVLKLAAEKGNWGAPLPKGSGRGIACHITWGVTYVAQVAEVSVDDNGNVRVQRVVCAIDCGVAVNPDMIKAQMEGGIVLATTAALKGEVTFKNGQAQLHSFHDYPLLRFDEMPIVEVYIVDSDLAPTGVGEMGNPPAVPAITNAIFMATGKRIRRLPIRAADLANS